MSIVCFRADKNGSTQTINDAVLTKLTWSNEFFDVGGYFASDKWTPPSGIVSLTASFWAQPTASSLANGTYGAVAIYKNGVSFAQRNARQFAGDLTVSVTITDSANGTDFYEAYAYADHASGGTAIVRGDTTYTYFSGRSLEATFTTVAFRKTLSRLGTRIGSRQVHH